MYVVGDIHGRSDLLREMLKLIRNDEPPAHRVGRPIVALLGDYVDRGPDSRGVIETILALEGDDTLIVGALRGNHDQFLLDFLEDWRVGARWMDYGGRATLHSYGVVPPRYRSATQEWMSASAQLNELMPPAHRDFLVRTAPYGLFGDYVLAHAGVRPGLPLESQSLEDLTTIRRPFLRHPTPLPGRTVVFGHTPFDAPLVTGAKIGLDTGAYATGILSALRISEDDQKIIQVSDRI
jgi:serine/threonine protein phosphatase 1